MSDANVTGYSIPKELRSSSARVWSDTRSRLLVTAITFALALLSAAPRQVRRAALAGQEASAVVPLNYLAATAECYLNPSGKSHSVTLARQSLAPGERQRVST